MPELASVNGCITSIDDARISINDRGLVFGDGVYEVIASYRGKLILFAEHLARLRRSLDEIRMNYVDVQPIADQITALFRQSGFERAKIYLQVSRGEVPREHAFPQPKVEPNVIITVREIHEDKADKLTHGVCCISRPDLRWGRVDIKTINLLPNCLAKQEAVENGCYEAILIGNDGLVREATSANLYVVRGRTIWTHPCNERILRGITRGLLLELMRKAGLPFREDAVTLSEMYQADEAFLSGTTTEVLPVVKIDDRVIGQGVPGPATRRLIQLYQEWLELTVG